MKGIRALVATSFKEAFPRDGRLSRYSLGWAARVVQEFLENYPCRHNFVREVLGLELRHLSWILAHYPIEWAGIKGTVKRFEDMYHENMTEYSTIQMYSEILDHLEVKGADRTVGYLTAILQGLSIEELVFSRRSARTAGAVPPAGPQYRDGRLF